jgi:hypothetical protein
LPFKISSFLDMKPGARFSTDSGLESTRFFLWVFALLSFCHLLYLVLMGVAFFQSDFDSDFDSALFSLCHRSYPQPVHCFPIWTSTYIPFLNVCFSLFSCDVF